MRITGIILLLVGIVMVLINGINYKKKDKVLDIGPLEVNKTETKHIGWPMYAGCVVAVAGVVLIVAGGKKN